MRQRATLGQNGGGRFAFCEKTCAFWGKWTKTALVLANWRKKEQISAILGPGVQKPRDYLECNCVAAVFSEGAARNVVRTAEPWVICALKPKALFRKGIKGARDNLLLILLTPRLPRGRLRFCVPRVSIGRLARRVESATQCGLLINCERRATCCALAG